MAQKQRLPVRTNRHGYVEYRDPNTGEWRTTHQRVAEKKFGGLRAGFHVHHLDGDKANNRYSNLVEVHPKAHGRLHADEDVCFRCGREGHWADECYARTFYDGEDIED